MTFKTKTNNDSISAEEILEFKKRLADHVQSIVETNNRDIGDNMHGDFKPLDERIHEHLNDLKQNGETLHVSSQDKDYFLEVMEDMMAYSTKLTAMEIINRHVSADIRGFVAKHSQLHEMRSLLNQYNSMIDEYGNEMPLAVLSTISMHGLASFNEWLPEAARNHEKVVPFLISKMLRGDIYALNMFDNLCQYTQRLDLTLRYNEIDTDCRTKNFPKHGWSEDSRAIVTAEHWLKSASAAESFSNAGDEAILCAAVTMLHIHNEHIMC